MSGELLKDLLPLSDRDKRVAKAIANEITLAVAANIDIGTPDRVDAEGAIKDVENVVKLLYAHASSGTVGE